MSDKLTCPHCGADGKVIAPGFTRYDCLSANDGGKFKQHARCKRIELERLRAVVEPLEKMLDLQGKYQVRDVLIQQLSPDFIPQWPAYSVTHYGTHRGNTLAEALSAAAKELEGQKE